MNRGAIEQLADPVTLYRRRPPPSRSASSACRPGLPASCGRRAAGCSGSRPRSGRCGRRDASCRGARCSRRAARADPPRWRTRAEHGRGRPRRGRLQGARAHLSSPAPTATGPCWPRRPRSRPAPRPARGSVCPGRSRTRWSSPPSRLCGRPHERPGRPPRRREPGPRAALPAPRSGGAHGVAGLRLPGGGLWLAAAGPPGPQPLGAGRDRPCALCAVPVRSVQLAGHRQHVAQRGPRHPGLPRRRLPGGDRPGAGPRRGAGAPAPLRHPALSVGGRGQGLCLADRAAPRRGGVAGPRRARDSGTRRSGCCSPRRGSSSARPTSSCRS